MVKLQVLAGLLLVLEMGYGGMNAAAMAVPKPQYYHHCLDPKHKFYEFCCESWLFPDCDGIHGLGNPLKPGQHEKNWEEGPPPPSSSGGTKGGDGGSGSKGRGA
ncbi:MAG: hypothetical protein L6R40_008247 [Gallowayella cf. fulva]|nr:MAG: hypothetical protein L6R40_008247 [Xanthomendoza cf. fulva]